MTCMDKAAAESYKAVETLRDGRPLTLRAIRPDDKGLVLDALKAVSADSLYRRFFTLKKGFTDEEMKRATEVDFVNVVALVALLEENGTDVIVGGGRYIKLGASELGQRAEVAFLVDDAHHGVGIGSRLFKHLAAIALRSGIVGLDADVLPTNDGMLRVFTRSGFPVAKSREEGYVHVTIELTPGGAPCPPQGADAPGGNS